MKIGVLPVIIVPCHLSQFDDQGIVDTDQTKAGLVRAQGVRENKGISPVIFGSGNGMAISKPVQLLRVDRVDVEASLGQALDYCASRGLDGDRYSADLAFCELREPVHELGDGQTCVLHFTLIHDLAVSVDRTNLVSVSSPVDTDPPGVVFMQTDTSLPGNLGQEFVEGSAHRDASSPLYRRSRRNSPLDVHHGPPGRGTGPPQAARSAGGKRVLPLGRPRHRVELSRAATYRIG